jgi:hypothetical protein
MKRADKYAVSLSLFGPTNRHSVDGVNDRPSWPPENSRHLTRNVHPTGRKPMPSDNLTRPLLIRQFYIGPASFAHAWQKVSAVMGARLSNRLRISAPIIRTVIQP